MGTTTYGYARVSTKDQNLDWQMNALSAFGVDATRVFADKASGCDFDRPEYRRMLERIEPGDVVVVKSIDRFGRNYDEIIGEWRRITRDAGCSIVVLDMPLLDTREDRGVTGRLISDIVLQLLSYVAQKERDFIHQRQAEGIAAAQERGVRFGRPPKRRPKAYEAAKLAFLSGAITKKEAAARMRVSPTTFEKWLREDGERR